MHADRVTALDGALGNEAVGYLIDQPLFVGEGSDQLSLTAEEWAAARRWVRKTGRPIRLKARGGAHGDPAGAFPETR